VRRARRHAGQGTLPGPRAGYPDRYHSRDDADRPTRVPNGGTVRLVLDCGLHYVIVAAGDEMAWLVLPMESVSVRPLPPGLDRRSAAALQELV